MISHGVSRSSLCAASLGGFKTINNSTTMRHGPGTSLVQLYFSLVRPHCDYALAVLSAHVLKDKAALKDVKKFACRMSTRCRDSSYHNLKERIITRKPAACALVISEG